MELSLALARILGWYMVLFAVATFVYKQRYIAIFNDFLTKPALGLVATIIPLVLGLIMVNIHNIWTSDWRVLITIMAWITLLKGVMWLFVPSHMEKVTANMATEKSIVIASIVSLLLGLFLLSKGHTSFIPW